MARKVLSGLRSTVYEHPFDRSALESLEKMPGVSMVLTKINEKGIDRLLRLQCTGSDIRVNADNFSELYQIFVETCHILDVAPLPELYLIYGTGHIETYTIGVDKPIVMINIDGMEKLSAEELVYVFGHEIAHIKSQHLLYHQTAIVLPAMKDVLNSTTLGLGGLATSGVALALYNWVMMAKFTADRAALLACQDMDVAIAALIKLAGLPGQYLSPKVIESFKAQALEFETQSITKLDKLTKTLSFMEYRYPWAVMRASELLRWVESGGYDAVMANSDSPNPEDPNIEDPNSEEEDTEEWNFMTSW